MNIQKQCPSFVDNYYTNTIKLPVRSLAAECQERNGLQLENMANFFKVIPLCLGKIKLKSGYGLLYF